MQYDFPVELFPIHTSLGEIPKKAAVVRPDTKEAIGIVSNKYGIIPHKTVIDSLNQVLDVEPKIDLSANGAKMFATYQLSGRIEVQKSDFITQRLVVKNSYDGSSTFQIMLGGYRLVCANGMIMGTDFFRFSQKHFAGAQMDFEYLKKGIASLDKTFQGTLPLMQKMAKQELEEVHFNPKEIQLPKYLVEEAQKNFDEQGRMTLWSYYNSLTFAITHKMKKENIETSIEYTRKAWSVCVGMMN